MFHQLNCCFKCGKERSDGFINEVIISSDPYDDASPELNVTISNNMGDILDLVIDRDAAAVMYLTMQYVLKYHYDIEKLPNLSVTQGELINCYNNMGKLLKQLNPESNRPVIDPRQ